MMKKRIHFWQINLVVVLLLIALVGSSTSGQTAPYFAATPLLEGRTFDQAHDTGYIDWNLRALKLY